MNRQEMITELLFELRKFDVERCTMSGWFMKYEADNL